MALRVLRQLVAHRVFWRPCIFLLSVYIASWLVLERSFAQDRPPGARLSPHRVLHVYPHDPKAFTQGLIYLDGYLYESTGLQGRSGVRRVDLETGAVLLQRLLPWQHFGEGLTHWKSDLLQLTWKSNLGFVYNRADFKIRRTFSYSGEGWGLTNDGNRLIMSDGTSTLRWIDPGTYQETGLLFVHDQGRPIVGLNELEYVDGEILANVWQSHRVARISPRTGEVVGWIDLAGLLSEQEMASSDVLNGIAYDSTKKRLFVTGKLWPRLFEIGLER